MRRVHLQHRLYHTHTTCGQGMESNPVLKTTTPEDVTCLTCKRIAHQRFSPAELPEEMQTILDNIALGGRPGKGLRLTKSQIANRLQRLKHRGLIRLRAPRRDAGWELTQFGSELHAMIPT